jgi:hypothetical protein
MGLPSIAAEGARRSWFGPLLAGAMLLASFAAPGSGVRAYLPFWSLPGVAYIGLLAGPVAWFGERAADRAPDLQFAAYGGPAYTMRSRVRLAQPNGTDMRFEGVRWKGEPFTAPPYYGLRGIYWLRNSHLGVMGDFTHIKAEAMRDSIVEQSGQRDGAAVPPREPLSATFKALEFTHGFNLVTLNLVRRGPLRHAAWVPYAGAGIGFAYPHVEMQRSAAPRESRTYSYQIAGPAFQVLAGIEWRFSPRFSLFAEYKLSCAAISGALLGGGDVATNLCAHQLLGGPAFHLKGRDETP